MDCDTLRLPTVSAKHSRVSDKHYRSSLSLLTCVFKISKMLVIAVAEKICHPVVHISPANCTDPLCPVFQACLVCQNAADFHHDGDTYLDLKRRFNISF